MLLGMPLHTPLQASVTEPLHPAGFLASFFLTMSAVCGASLRDGYMRNAISSRLRHPRPVPPVSVPPLPLHSNRSCIASGGGGKGTVAFGCANLLRVLDIVLLLCVCWLDKVVLLVHCCVLQLSCIQGTPMYPVSCRTLQIFAI